MYYLVYKTTNLVNGKYYIGAHQCNSLNDKYIGSGKLLKYAIAKYGINNFAREILFFASSKEEMFLKEKEFVVNCISESYNLKEGGYGGFDHVNDSSHNHIQRSQKCRALTNVKLLEKYGDNWHQIISRRGGIRKNELHPPSEKFKKAAKVSFLGKSHTSETKMLMSKKAKQRPSNSVGLKWITNGINNRKVSKTSECPDGWRFGKTQRNN